ncbi:hypothetical protein HA402_006754 [Bradysia odoriphaga]|nr:hypothetical protein HA402_006754 [Bradysia odoriphaga]
MASVIRSGIFFRHLTGLARNLVLNSHRNTDANLIKFGRLSCSAFTHSRGFASAIQRPDLNLDESIKKLDQDVRRIGRISRRDIEEVFDEVRRIKTASSSQSLLLIRCCGNLVPEELPEVRTALVQEIWKTLNNLNVEMDITHYNALLRVYLENEHPFSPTEFLADLEAKGIEPNRVTYQSLISRYCQEGDMDGATKTLEFMLPINENVFSSMIMGHSEAGDIEAAIGILPVMREAGMKPSSDTYTNLLCAYAKHGKMDEILTTLDEFHERVMLPVPNAVNPHGRGRFPTPSPFNISSPYISHGPGFVRNEYGYVNNEGPSQIYPAASSGYSFVGNDGRISCADPQLASFTVNTAQSGLGHISQPAVNSMNSIGGNSEVTVSTDRSSVTDTNFLNNQRLKLIHKIILFYKANTTLYDKHTTAFDKKDWLSLAYTNDGSLRADMYCPVCLGGINPIYRKTGSWEFTNMKRHFLCVHPDDVKIKPTTVKAVKKTRTVEVPEDDNINENNKTLLRQEGAMVENSKIEHNETSMDSKVTKAGINNQNKASDVAAEKDSLDVELSSGKEDPEHDSNVGKDKVTMQTKERKKTNSLNKSRFNKTTSKCEREKRNRSKNGHAVVSGRNETKRKQRKDKSGKAVHFSYEDNLKLVAFTQQASHGPLDLQNASPLGVLDVIGRDRRMAWQQLAKISKPQAMEGFVDLLDRLCPLFKPYVEAIKKDR